MSLNTERTSDIGREKPLHTEKHVTATTRGTGREQKDAVGEASQHVAETGKQLYEKACDVCNNWRHYPKLLTTVVLLTTFLIGAGSMGVVGKLRGGGSNYVTAHWDRNTYDAHHALDIILDHLKHPELYESTKQGTGVITGAREKITNFLRGIVPGVGRGKVARGFDSSYDTDSSWFGSSGPSSGRMGMGMRDSDVSGIGRKIYDKAGDVKDELSYRMSDVGDTAKNVGYGIGSKLSNMASSLKDSVVGTGSDDSYYDSAKHHVKRGMQQMEGDVRGHRTYGYDEEDELRMANKQLGRIVRQAEREL